MKKHFKDIIKHPLFSGTVIMIFGSNSVNFINYIYHFFMGRMLGPGGYGELAAVISLLGLVGIVPASINLVIVKYIASEKDEEGANNLINWFKSKIFQISLIFSLLFLFLSPEIASFLKIQNISYFLLISLSLLFSLQANFSRAILQGLLKFKNLVMSILIENSTKLIISVVLVFLGLQVFGVMVALAVSSILGFYTTYLYLKNKSSKEKRFSGNLKPMFLFVLPVTVQYIATTSLYSSDLILVKHFFPSFETGLYASLSTLGKIIFFATGPINSVMFPLIAQRKARNQNYQKIFIYSFMLVSMIAGGVMLIYWLLPTFTISLPYGKEYLGSKDLLVWFGGFMTLFTLSSLIINFSLSLGRTKVVVLPLIAAIAQIVLIWLFHKTLFEVVLVSTCVTALLLVLLLIYSSYGSKAYFNNRPSI